MKRYVSLVLILMMLLTAAPALSEVTEEVSVDDIIRGMSLHEKVCQLFFLQPEQFSRTEQVNRPDSALEKAFGRFPVGGIILFASNITKANIGDLTAAMQTYARDVNGIGLLIGTDEEGGGISTLAGKLKLEEKQPYAAEVGAGGDPEQAYASAVIIGSYLSLYGFNLDFAPVADVRTQVKNAEIRSRSYGEDPQMVAGMVERFVDGLHDCRIIPVLKHFPGHGAVSGNTHDGLGISRKTVEEWRETDFIPFMAGIRADAEIVMLSHQSAVNVDPDAPASLSPKIVSMLREELGFEGVIITDALRMDAIHEQYGSGEACVKALEAGADMLLLPYNFTNAYNGVMKALKEGRLTEDRIDESLRRILLLKEKYGLLDGI